MSETLASRLASIAAAAQQSPDTDAYEFAKNEIAKMSADELRNLAIAEVADIIERSRRSRVQQIERKSMTISELRQRSDENREERAQTDRDVFAVIYANPGRVNWATGSKHIARYPDHLARKRFIKWLGDRYAEWWQRASIAWSDRTDGERLLSDFYCDGPSAYYALRRAEAVDKLIEEVRESTRLEVTEELMDALFALGDGTKVSWGDATIEQHRQRLAMLHGNLDGLAETAGRHARAIEMLEESGAHTLRQIANVSIEE